MFFYITQVCLLFFLSIIYIYIYITLSFHRRSLDSSLLSSLSLSCIIVIIIFIMFIIVISYILCT